MPKQEKFCFRLKKATGTFFFQYSPYFPVKCRRFMMKMRKERCLLRAGTNRFGALDKISGGAPLCSFLNLPANLQTFTFFVF